MVDPFRLQGLLHAFSKQETNYMCENAQHWSQAHYWKREKVSHKNRTERERDDKRLHINKSNGLHRM